MIDYFHKWLDDRGIGRGDVVVLSSHNSTEVYALFFALMERGAVFFGTHIRAFYDIPRYREAGAKLAVVDDPYCYEQALEHSDVFNRIDLLPSLRPADLVDIEPVVDLPVVHNSERAIIAATSGSTGEPVVIAHTHESLLTPCQNAQKLFFKPEDRALCYLNLNHIGFLSVFTLPIFFAGCTVVLAGQDDIDRLYAKIKRKRLTKMLCFPWMMTQFTQIAETEGTFIDLTGIEVVTGGQTISHTFMKQCFAAGAVAVHNAYGMTEVPPPVMVKSDYAANFDPEQYDPLFMGTPVNGNEVKVSKTRAICIRSKGIGQNLDGSSLAESDGFIVTGDSGLMTENGIFNGGRLIVFKRDGERIMVNDAMQAIESMLVREPIGEYICMFVIRRPEWPHPIFVCFLQKALSQKYNMTLETINETITRRIDRFHYLDILCIMDEVPNNGLKVDGTRARTVIHELLDRHFAGEDVSDLYIKS